VRFFNFWEPDWPEPLDSQLNPDVTVRGKGIMEKCTFCVQRINRAKRTAARENRTVQDGELQPACAQSCPTDALVFGNMNDPNSRVAQLAKNDRAYHLLGELGTNPSVVYLAAVDEGQPIPPPPGATPG
jgi:molybdopterin-containing oxidoreductase family iron-sulfur binding subunit